MISKESVDYRVCGGKRCCGNCSMFLRKEGACTLVRGTIRAHDTCDEWEAKEKGGPGR